MTPRSARRRSNEKSTDATVRFETLEPRNMLAANWGILDAYDTSLISTVQDHVPVEQGMEVLRSHVGAGQNDSFELLRHDQDHIGFEHFKYQHLHNGVPVDNSTYTVHAKDGWIVSLSGFYHQVDTTTVAPTLNEATALDIALRHVGAEQYVWEETSLSGGHAHDADDLHEVPRGHLLYLDRGDETTGLAFRFDVFATHPVSRSYVFVDASNGDIVDVRERIHHADVPATGTTLYDANVGFTADFTGTEYRLRQVADGVETYDLNESTNYNDAVDIVSSSTFFSDPGTHTGNQAHYGTEQTLSYFQDRHGRDSFDGSGTTLISYVSYNSNYTNAFWNGSWMTYGDGNGVSRGPLVSLDIVGHEIAHGVTQFSAGLIYRDHSGALNESFSDIFGESVENFARGSNDWFMGADIGLNGNTGQFRSMMNPKQFADPDTYLGDYWFTGNGDQGGVHTNSGVQNKWFYIMVNGEVGTNDTGHSYNVTGVGIQDAAEIAYRNLTVYLNSNSTYPDARAGAIQSSIDLFGVGSQQHLSTMAAWDAVGVYDLSLTLDPLATRSLGSQVYADSAINQILYASDTDAFELYLDEHQTISLTVANMTGDLLPHLSVTAPDSTVLGDATATTTTETVLLQTIYAEKAGVYTLEVDGASNTTGLYELRLQLNGAMETEPLDLVDNDTLGNAQDLDPSNLTQGFLLTSTVDRLAVTGELGGSGSVVGSEGFESGSLDGSWTTSSSTGNGQILVASDTGTPYGAYALAMDTSAIGFNLNEAVYTVDMTTVVNADLSFAHVSFGDETHILPGSFTGSFNGDGVSISDDGTTWHTIMTGVTPGSGVWVDFEIDLVDAANTAGISLVSDFKIKFQQYDNFGRNSDGRGFDNIQVGMISNDWYSFTLDADERVTVGATQVSGDPTQLEIELYDAAGVLLTTGTSGPEVTSFVENHHNASATTETFYVNVVGASSLYNLVVVREGAFDLENGTVQDISDLEGVLGFVSDAIKVVADPDAASSGDNVSSFFTGVTLSNPVNSGDIFAVQSAFTAPTGLNVFGRSSGNDDGFREGVHEFRADFDDPQAFVSIDVGSDDTLDIGVLRAYDASDNLLEEVIGQGVPHSGSETLTVYRPTNDIAYVVAAGYGSHTAPLDNLVFETVAVDSELFDVNAVVGQQLDFQGYLPGEGPFEFENRLDGASGSELRMELLDPTGTVVANGTLFISHVATQTGTWQLRVTANAGDGEYYIARSINIIPDKFDFGPESSPVLADWTQADTDVYNAVSGYGWVGPPRGMTSVEFSRGNALTGDGIQVASRSFVIDVDNGTYDVSFHFGFSLHLDDVRINLEGTDHVLTPQANQVATYQTVVNDGQLRIGMSGNFGQDSLLRLAGLKYTEVTTAGFASTVPSPPTDAPEILPTAGFARIATDDVTLAPGSFSGIADHRVLTSDPVAQASPLPVLSSMSHATVANQRGREVDGSRTLDSEWNDVSDFNERGQILDELLDERFEFPI